jgi:hypothetical protein
MLLSLVSSQLAELGKATFLVILSKDEFLPDLECRELEIFLPDFKKISNFGIYFRLERLIHSNSDFQKTF